MPASSFCCYVSIRQHTSAYVSIRQHTSAYVSIRQHTSAYVSIRRHTSAYVGIRQHTSAYVSIRQRRRLQCRMSVSSFCCIGRMSACLGTYEHRLLKRQLHQLHLSLKEAVAHCCTCLLKRQLHQLHLPPRRRHTLVAEGLIQTLVAEGLIQTLVA
jgi:hypothetical protein